MRYALTMLDRHRIDEIASEIVRVSSADGLERVVTKAAMDSEGQEALRITVVLKPETARTWTGDQALDLLVSIHRSLQAAGEERFPIVEYATEQELADEGEQVESTEDDDQPWPS